MLALLRACAGGFLRVCLCGWLTSERECLRLDRRLQPEVPLNLEAATLPSPGVAASSLASLEAPLFQHGVLGVCPRAYIY